MSNQSSQNPETFENDNITVQVKRQPGCRVHFDVAVSPKATEASHHKAIKVVSKEVSVPGFRKGKVPQAMIMEHYAKHVEKEWKDILLETTFNEAVTLTKLTPFNKESINKATIVSASLKEGAKLVYEFEQSPQIPTIAAKDLTLKNTTIKTVSDQDVATAIEDLRLQQATFDEINERPVQEGDFVTIDVDIISEPARNICTDSRFPVSEGKMDAWMRKLVIGMKPGETVEGMSEKESKNEEDCEQCEHDHDHSHHHEHDQFTPVKCRITLHTINQAKLPEVDDEFSKKFGATSAVELRERVETSLKNRAQEEFLNTKRSNLKKLLIEQYPVELPASLILNQVKEYRKPIIDDLRSQGTEESAIPEEAKKIEASIALNLQRDYSLFFIAQKIGHDHNLQVTPSEVSMEWMRQNWLKQMGQNTIEITDNQEEGQSRIHTNLMIIKSLDFLLDQLDTAKKA